MLEISKPEIATYFIARSESGDILHTGEIGPDLVVSTGQAILESYTDDNSNLQALSAYPDKFPSLPAQGEQVEANQLYSYQGGVVKARQSHTRTEHTDLSLIPALFSVYQPGGGTLDWIANEQVYLGTLRIYQGQTYRCIQAHTTQSDWQPPNVPALWEVYVPPSQTGEWAPGTAYAIGDRVMYQGTEFECIQAHTSLVGWEPQNVPALWTAA